MSTLAFDTHKAVKALKEAGFDDPQAEAVVSTVGDAIGGTAATKADITELKADIERLRQATKGDVQPSSSLSLSSDSNIELLEHV